MPSEQPTLHGRAAIIAHNKAFFEQFTVKATLVPEQTEVFGDHAFDRGTYTVEWTPKKGGKPETAEGRFLVVLRRRADGWKVIADIDNEPAAKK
jgi:ketosteroid isomerase-like protein